MINYVLLDHGSGGLLSQDLIRNIFLKYFNTGKQAILTDSALLKVPEKELAMTTDSYVVNPVFFPGGNIGKLAVCGTVNDLAVVGATPLYISCGFIIEEGFPLKDLEIIVKSMATEAKNAGIKIVTGDTKVVEKGSCDKLFINTTGIGILHKNSSKIAIGKNIKVGDKIIINGSIAEHGLAVMMQRHGFQFDTKIKSDCASLNHLIQKILVVCPDIKFMRDATRGGLASVLCECVEKRTFGIKLYEPDIPVKEQVKGISELLGFDPLYVANEGKVVMVVSTKDTEAIMNIMKKDTLGKHAAVIGEVVKETPGTVTLKTNAGGHRIVHMLTGAQLPRIC
ncbi:MAG: hydrogenase expression/formation protein HypE [Candidatus Margulisbacteria bacterium]|nr:hydrogenase expression/formation protein HypE [Candidatus Margulisiibacteriota bacterium]